MSELLQKATEYVTKNLPFVIYSKPDEADIIGIFQKDVSLNYTEDFTEAGFVFAPFDGEKFVLIPENGSDVLVEKFVTINSEKASAIDSEINLKDKEEFENLVQKGIDVINLGILHKVVLSRTEAVSVENADVIYLFQKLVSSYSTAFKYCFFHPKVGLWLGATPEQLLKVNSNEIKTVALAGTQVFKEGQITWENKEREEQQFVTDFILDNLSEFVSAKTFTKPYTFRAGNIVHIKTDILATLKDKKEVKKVLQILHPTPAVCGIPGTEAKEFILKNEGYKREYYSGFLGELNKDFAKNETEKSDLFVNLRCMKINDKTANLFIGCGITKDSNPEKEFFETVNKSLTMKKILR
jgi:isochorismate synthase